MWGRSHTFCNGLYWDDTVVLPCWFWDDTHKYTHALHTLFIRLPPAQISWSANGFISRLSMLNKALSHLLCRDPAVGLFAFAPQTNHTDWKQPEIHKHSADSALVIVPHLGAVGAIPFGRDAPVSEAPVSRESQVWVPAKNVQFLSYSHVSKCSCVGFNCSSAPHALLYFFSF